MTKPQWKIDFDTWAAAWRVEHPLPPMRKNARWKIEHAAWLAMRAEAKHAERTADAAANRRDLSNLPELANQKPAQRLRRIKER